MLTCMESVRHSNLILEDNDPKVKSFFCEIGCFFFCLSTVLLCLYKGLAIAA